MTNVTLETDRLILSPPAIEDYSALLSLWTQEPVYRHITGWPMTGEEVWLRLLRDIGHWQVFGFGNWRIRLKTDNSYVGNAGVFHFNRDIDPPITVPEAGWVFNPDYHGCGYATEAVLAVLEFADKRLKAPEIACIISPDNEPSLKLARKMGFEYQVTTTFHGKLIVLLERHTDI